MSNYEKSYTHKQYSSCVHSPLELETKVAEDYTKFNNHGEGPYQDLLLVESTS